MGKGSTSSGRTALEVEESASLYLFYNWYNEAFLLFLQKQLTFR